MTASVSSVRIPPARTTVNAKWAVVIELRLDQAVYYFSRWTKANQFFNQVVKDQEPFEALLLVQIARKATPKGVRE